MVSFLFRPRFENDSCKTILISSSARGVDFLLKNDTSILFRSRCWLFVEKRYFYPFSPEVQSWSLFTDTSIIFRMRLKADLYLLILLSSSVRRSKLILKWWLAHLTGLTVESQSSLVLFRSCTWRLVKLGSIPSYTWKPIKLVALILSYVYLPRLTLDCQCFFIYLLT